MIGEIVPVVMIPRYTSFLGPGTYTTVPMLVSDYKSVVLEFWCGYVQAQPSGALSTATFEEAFDAELPDGAWVTLATKTEVDQNTQSLLNLTFTRRYFRVRFVLTADSNGLVGFTCWAAGSLQKRVPEEHT